MSDKKYVLYCTPKAASKLQTDKLPPPYNNVEIIPTNEIYINMLYSSWTEEECDNTAYIVEK